jgi:hypothetical protein
MSMIDIKELFRASFGYEPPSEFAIPRAKYYLADVYGREYFLPVTLDGYLVPFAVVGVSRTQLIVSTSMPERDGSVHEQISLDDVIINVKGVLIMDDNTYPERLIIELNDIFEKKRSVVMRSVLTDIFLDGASNHKVLIKRLDFPAIGGVENAKPFEMEIISDKIFELELL